MRKIYRKLTKDQKERGIIFSSTLSTHTTELSIDSIHEVHEDDPNRHEKIQNLKDDSFFDNLQWKYNIIRQ